MQFPARDLTNQYISLSYHDVVQRYAPGGTASYFLDGTGNVIAYVPTASIGKALATLDDIVTSNSASWASASLSASYAATATIASVALISENSLTSSFFDGNGIVRGGLQFDTASAVGVSQEGYVFWDNDNHTLAIKPDFVASTLQVGQEQWLRVLAGENIGNGQAVYLSGSITHDGHLETVAFLALADATATKSGVVGIATNAISSGSHGIITTNGVVNDIDTSGLAEGGPAWLSSTSSGSLASFPPIDPFAKVLCGYCIKSDATNGKLYVSVVGLPHSNYPFVGVTSLPTITAVGSSSFTIGVGKANLCTTADGTGAVKNYTIPSASFTLNTSSLLDVQHIVVTYNSGTPIYQLVTDRSSVDSVQTTMVYSLTPAAGGQISQVDYDTPGHLLANKLLTRLGYTRGIERATGFALAESASKGITISAGTAWMGAKNLSLPAVNSSGSRFVLLAHSASAWSSSLVTGSYNTIVDNGTNIVALSNNKYVVNYVYRGIGSLTSSIVMLSPEYASLTTAQSSQPPTPPSEFLEIAFLVGRMIYQQGTNTAIQVDSAFAQNFTPSGISNHNDLTGLQGGLAGEYYHLTSASYAATLAVVSNGARSIHTTATNYNALISDYTIVASGSSAITVTLPAVSASHGKIFIIKNRNTNPVFIAAADSALIDGDGPITSSFKNSSIQLQCSGSEWFIL